VGSAVDIDDVPTSAGEDQRAADQHGVLDRYGAERAASLDKAVLVGGLERGVEAVVIDELIAAFAVQSRPSLELSE
jgi:hypothetical protein